MSAWSARSTALGASTQVFSFQGLRGSDPQGGIHRQDGHLSSLHSPAWLRLKGSPLPGGSSVRGPRPLLVGAGSTQLEFALFPGWPLLSLLCSGAVVQDTVFSLEDTFLKKQQGLPYMKDD